MKFSIKDFFSKCDQIRRQLWIWSHLLKKSLMKNFSFCAVYQIQVIGKTSTLSTWRYNAKLYEPNKIKIGFPCFE